MHDNDTQLERLYRNTWLCTKCGSRHSFEMSVCPYAGSSTDDLDRDEGMLEDRAREG